MELSQTGKARTLTKQCFNGGIKLKELKYEIIKTVGVLSESPKGWTKELNLISWNGREPKYDIRDWAPDHEKMGKGVTLTEEEVTNLKKVIEGME
ncbi:hypothetical protein SAMN05518684_10891 [Salipaludibacillus aurantiacus]|uniref:Transcriptional coactivator p15 (PC4) C-terminal domain-containing protein n=1 Tax=Salipaludibacillus aurantiacus TaxID=1601833 RepID=A0A1H9UQ10_9BACI|nr:hypothetical protein SAMN05518684_10891 [Salipaludibacillus aurantiacus]